MLHGSETATSCMHLNYSKVFVSAASLEAEETLGQDGFVLRVGLSPFESYIEGHLWSVIMFRGY